MHYKSLSSFFCKAYLHTPLCFVLMYPTYFDAKQLAKTSKERIITLATN